MIHAAVEQCRPGDVLVVTTTSPCRDGLFGELLATSLRAHGVRGTVLTTGVRDVADLRAFEFPVWSAAVSAQGTVKATAGAVNVLIAIGGVLISPGDVVVADDDGVVVVARADVEQTVRAGARPRGQRGSHTGFAVRPPAGTGPVPLAPAAHRPRCDLCCAARVVVGR
jgi:4-hydroxy-4-methyl-2-oxoglutarate aldolase